MLSDLAQRWLVYARAVFRCANSGHACDAPSIADIDNALRWPGFVGANYERARTRLLLVGRIHNPSGWRAWPGLGTLEPLVRDWVSGRSSDAEFYRQYSERYAQLLVTWGPWRKVYAFLAEAAGVDADGVAYTNVAKCWQYPGKESAMQRLCSQAFPLQNLVDILQPHGVFVLAPDSWVSRVPGVSVASTAFMNDSAPHFQLPYHRLNSAIEWVENLAG